MWWRIPSVSILTMKAWHLSLVIQERLPLRSWTELRKQNPDYSNDAIVGKAGIEQYMELTLQGTDGKETVSVDNLGKVSEN